MDIGKSVKNAAMLNNMTPAQALELLKEGNKRFLSKDVVERDHDWHIRETRDSQHPFAFILGCIDSRVLASIIFDQGIGDIFVGRIGGSIINQDILGGMEYACAVSGSKLILVLGHTSCGAVKGAIDDVKLGNLTAALKPIKLAIAHTPAKEGEPRNSKNLDFVNRVAEENVKLSMEDIKSQSPVLLDLYNKGEIDIVGAMYNHATGEVRFL
jgi:carbonic anhydrase